MSGISFYFLSHPEPLCHREISTHRQILAMAAIGCIGDLTVTPLLSLVLLNLLHSSPAAAFSDDSSTLPFTSRSIGDVDVVEVAVVVEVEVVAFLHADAAVWYFRRRSTTCVRHVTKMSASRASSTTRTCSSVERRVVRPCK